MGAQDAPERGIEMTIMVLLFSLFSIFPRPVGPAPNVASIYSVQPSTIHITSYRTL